MRIVILGANGMLGHQICGLLGQEHDCYATFRRPVEDVASGGPFKDWRPDHLIGGVDAEQMNQFVELLNRIKPEVVINCIGIVKQRRQAKETIPSIQINALFPQLLAELCSDLNARLLHFSTDCVFSGDRGTYREVDNPDPVDLYGRSKLLGELSGTGCLTLRLSIVGWELGSKQGLLEWFADQRYSQIHGFRRAIYTGLSTATTARLVQRLIEEWPYLDGIYHVASSPISKYELLVQLRDRLGWNDIMIRPDDEFHCDRSLVGERFSQLTGWRAPGWEKMIDELAREWPTYEQWRQKKRYG